MATALKKNNTGLSGSQLGLLAGGLFVVLSLAAYLAGDLGTAWALLKPVDSPEAASVHIQFQKTDFRQLHKLPVDVLILDADMAELTAEQLALLKLRPNGERRTVLAYLNVGQAEAYRDYWGVSWHVGSPSYLLASDTQWPGRFPVAYWDWRWRRLVVGQARDLAKLGYDGLYLAGVEEYERAERSDRKSARSEMISLIRAIRSGSRRINSDFLLVPRNASGLYGEKRWRNAVDGLAQESVWYVDGHKRPVEEVSKNVFWLDRALADGKFVLAIDYPTANEDICLFYDQCWSHGYACTVSNRALDRPAPIECLQ